MRGAIVFVVAFVIFLAITLGYQDLPPGETIYGTLNLPETIEYRVLELPAKTLIIAIFNGVIYGIIIWVIYWLAEKAGVTCKAHPKQTTATATTA